MRLQEVLLGRELMHNLEVPLILWTPLRHNARRRCPMKRDRRAFSQEFKEEAVGRVRRSGKSANQVAKELGINQTTLSRWQREADDAPPRTHGFLVAEELKQLRREVERFRMERDILKKAAAFFAKESA